MSRADLSRIQERVSTRVMTSVAVSLLLAGLVAALVAGTAEPIPSAAPLTASQGPGMGASQLVDAAVLAAFFLLGFAALRPRRR